MTDNDYLLEWAEALRAAAGTTDDELRALAAEYDAIARNGVGDDDSRREARLRAEAIRAVLGR